MTDIDGVRMYFGTASGSARKALYQMEEPHVMLSAQAEMGVPWDGIDHLFVDSGGYSLMIAEGEHPPADDYLDTVADYDADMFAVQDYPCEPGILDKYGRSVRDHQRRTTVATAQCLVRAEERGIDAEPLAVIQGWDSDDYIRHIRELRAEGLLTEHIGIGSVCRRNQDREIRRIIADVANELKPHHKIHAFGVKNSILADKATRERLHSADTTAWYFRNYQDRNDIDDTWQEMVSQYLEYRRNLGQMAGVLDSPQSGQSTLTESLTSADGGREQ